MSIGLFTGRRNRKRTAGRRRGNRSGTPETDGQGAFPCSRKFPKVCSGSPAPCSKSSEAVLR